MTTDPDIEALNLSDTAKKAAYALKSKYPSVTFTSGRRNKAEQARAMASNVIFNRTWIKDTYVPSEARDCGDRGPMQNEQLDECRDDHDAA